VLSKKLKDLLRRINLKQYTIQYRVYNIFSHIRARMGGGSEQGVTGPNTTEKRRRLETIT
jgi:hypothetical protein